MTAALFSGSSARPDNALPQRSAGHSHKLSRSTPQTDKTISKLSKTVRLDRTIPRKTLGVITIRTAGKNYRREALQPIVRTVSPTAEPMGGAEQSRTSPNEHT